MSPRRVVSSLSIIVSTLVASCVVYQPPARPAYPGQPAQGPLAQAPAGQPSQPGFIGAPPAAAPVEATPPPTEAVPVAPDAAPVVQQPAAPPVTGPTADEFERMRAMMALANPPEPTDHDQMIGRYGVSARYLGTVERAARPGETCGAGTTSDPCALSMVALSVRHWLLPHYAWNAGLVVASGGGSSSAGTFDTYFGVGPTVSANFLLANWKHVAVSLVPEGDFTYFFPRGSGAKTFMLNLNAAIEAEVHLGFIGMPALSAGTSTGLGFRYMHEPEAVGTSSTDTANSWQIAAFGPTSPWGLLTNVYLRYYF